jgi:hypothetical protein
MKKKNAWSNYRKMKWGVATTWVHVSMVKVFRRRGWTQVYKKSSH